jgi:hypothetical protein
VESASFPQQVQTSVPNVQVQVQPPKDRKVMIPVDVATATSYFFINSSYQNTFVGIFSENTRGLHANSQRGIQMKIWAFLEITFY